MFLLLKLFNASALGSVKDLIGFGEEFVGMNSFWMDTTMQDDKHDATQLLIIRSEGMLSQSAEEIIFTDQWKSAWLDVVAQVVQCKRQERDKSEWTPSALES